MNAVTLMFTIFIACIVTVFGIAYAQVMVSDTKQVDSVKDTVSEQDSRKSFGYCPDSSILDKYGITYTLESCPLSRLYIDSWDKLDDTTKQTIYNELINKGWRVEKE